jgi:hypothetical protein
MRNVRLEKAVETKVYTRNEFIIMCKRNMSGPFTCPWCKSVHKTSRALKVHQNRSRYCPGPPSASATPVQEAIPIIPNAASSLFNVVTLFPDASQSNQPGSRPLPEESEESPEGPPFLRSSGHDVGVGRKRNALSRKSTEIEVQREAEFDSAWELYLAFSWCNNGQGLAKRDFNAIFNVLADYRYKHQALLAYDSSAAYDEWGNARLANDDPGWRDTFAGHPKCPDIPFRTCDTEKVT